MREMTVLSNFSRDGPFPTTGKQVQVEEYLIWVRYVDRMADLCRSLRELGKKCTLSVKIVEIIVVLYSKLF